jgi:hypothetical protein
VRLRGKTDANQSEIRQALHKVGASTHSLAQLGAGCPDLLVGYRQRTYLMEIKAPKGRLTDQQKDWMASWNGAPVHVVHDIDEAFRAIGVLP